MPDTAVNPRELWVSTLAQIELEVTKANFVTWFNNVNIHKYEEGTIFLSVPNTFVRDWLKNKYHSFILRSLRDNCHSIRCVEYTISKRESLKEPSDSISIGKSSMEQLEIRDLITEADGLNSRYTFENFVVGSFNELAYAATQAVIRNPGINYNPLFIYGPTGVGKTHLAQAVGNHLKKVDRDTTPCYLSAEKFGGELVEAIRNNKAHIFKEKFRKYDVLIMDDVQFLSGKQKMQEELFHIFNTLHDKNKQIIFTSDKTPSQISDIEERLKSRFQGGMVTDISKPGFEDRLAILGTKSIGQEVAIQDEVLEYIASVVDNNIRELEGILNLVSVQSLVKKRNLTIGEVKSLIKNSVKPRRTVSVKDVIRKIAEFYNINEQELFEKTRKKEIVKPRQVVMYLLREDFSASYPYIGNTLGGRDHTTVIHAYEKIKRELKVDTLLATEINEIKNLLYENS